MGPPGSGKGTISQRIARSFGLEYLSSGHFLRDSVAANTGKTHSTVRLPDVSPSEFKRKPLLIPTFNHKCLSDTFMPCNYVQGQTLYLFKLGHFGSKVSTVLRYSIILGWLLKYFSLSQFLLSFTNLR